MQSLESGNIGLRYQQVGDAASFFKILRNPHFIFSPVAVKTIEEERAFLRLNREKRKNRQEFNFTIFYKERLVGGCGVRIDMFR